jgi:hypothetical protein
VERRKRKKENEHEELDDDTDWEEEALLDDVWTHRDGKVLEKNVIGRKEGARLARGGMSVLVSRLLGRSKRTERRIKIVCMV